MDEVELIGLACSYLEELDYDIDSSTDVVVKNNNVSFHKNTVSFQKILSAEETNKVLKYISIMNIDFYIDDKQVMINDKTSRFLYKDYMDFNKNDSSKLTEFVSDTEISFSRLKDNVIKSTKSEFNISYNGKNNYSSNSSNIEIIEVDSNYELTDGYPIKKHVKYNGKE